MGKELLVVLPVVKVSEGVEFLVAATAEEMLTETKEAVKEVTSPTVDPATVGTVVVPKTSVWFCVSMEKAEVSSNGFLLIVTKLPMGVGVLGTVVSLSLMPLVGSVASRVVTRVTDSEVLVVDKVSVEAVVLGMFGSGSVELDKADVSEVDRAVTSVGLWSVFISVMQLVTSIWVMLKATKSLAGVATSGVRACEPVRTPTKLSEEELLSEDRLSASVEVCAIVKRSIVIFLASSELSSVQRLSKIVSMGSLTVSVSAVLTPVCPGLLLVAEVSRRAVYVTPKLEGIIFGRVLVFVAEVVWLSRAGGTEKVAWVSRVDASWEVV